MLECDRTHVGNHFPCDDSLASVNELLVLVHQAQILFDSWCWSDRGNHKTKVKWSIPLPDQKMGGAGVTGSAHCI